MAWIKIEHVLPDKPEVVMMADLLKINADEVVGKLLRFWIWADGITQTGDALSVTSFWLDVHVRCAGFAQAMCKVGWLKEENGALSIPNFERHNSQTSKRRALTANRTSKYRDVRSVTNVTRKASPDKRREDKNKEPPLPPLGGTTWKWVLGSLNGNDLDTDAFRSAWSLWEKHRAERKPKLKRTAVTAQVGKLEEMGHDRAIAAITHSIACSYQGIFEPNGTTVAPTPAKPYEYIDPAEVGL